MALGRTVTHVSCRHTMSYVAKYSGICILFVISSVSLVTGAKFKNCDCGLSYSIENRIVGGWNAVPHEFPWLAAINHKGILHCGGALINNRYILTAGHCVKWTEDKDLTVVLGQHDTQVRDGVSLQILKSIMHENFYSHNLFDENDIALIKLREPVKFTENISPVCLPRRGLPYDDIIGTVAGWGKLGEDGISIGPLQQTVVKILTRKACAKTKMRRYVDDFVVCAYTERSDACQGDSGGPLIAEEIPGKAIIMGIVSWGFGCGNYNSPGMYTKVTYFLDWIYRNTKDAYYCNAKFERKFNMDHF